MSEEADILVDCCEHGKKASAIVCCHLLQTENEPIDFIENSSVPGDCQAWCGKCEDLFFVEKEMTERFLAYNDFAVICEACYETIKTHCSNRG